MTIPVSILFLLMFILFPVQEDPYREKRERMVRQQMKNRDIRDALVLKAMSSVKRHLFVPQELTDGAYEDRPLPIGYGQTISQPYMVAYMTQIIKPNPEFKALEIGTGSGYQAAVLAEILKEAYTIEIVPELGQAAAKRLESLGYKNVKVKLADGYYGWEENGPYDAIVVTAAAEYIPPPLLKQLKEGGKMVIPVGSPFMTQALMLVEKRKGKAVTRSLMPVVFVPFTRSNK